MGRVSLCYSIDRVVEDATGVCSHNGGPSSQGGFKEELIEDFLERRGSEERTPAAGLAGKVAGFAEAPAAGKAEALNGNGGKSGEAARGRTTSGVVGGDSVVGGVGGLVGGLTAGFAGVGGFAEGEVSAGVGASSNSSSSGEDGGTPRESGQSAAGTTTQDDTGGSPLAGQTLLFYGDSSSSSGTAEGVARPPSAVVPDEDVCLSGPVAGNDVCFPVLEGVLRQPAPRGAASTPARGAGPAGSGAGAGPADSHTQNTEESRFSAAQGSGSPYNPRFSVPNRTTAGPLYGELPPDNRCSVPQGPPEERPLLVEEGSVRPRSFRSPILAIHVVPTCGLLLELQRQYADSGGKMHHYHNAVRSTEAKRVQHLQSRDVLVDRSESAPSASDSGTLPGTAPGSNRGAGATDPLLPRAGHDPPPPAAAEPAAPARVHELLANVLFLYFQLRDFCAFYYRQLGYWCSFYWLQLAYLRFWHRHYQSRLERVSARLLECLLGTGQLSGLAFVTFRRSKDAKRLRFGEKKFFPGLYLCNFRS